MLMMAAPLGQHRMCVVKRQGYGGQSVHGWASNKLPVSSDNQRKSQDCEMLQ